MPGNENGNGKVAFMSELISIAAKVATVLLLPILGYCSINLIKLNEDVAVLKTEIASIKASTQRNDDIQVLERRINDMERGFNDFVKDNAERNGAQRTEILEFRRRLDILDNRRQFQFNDRR